MDSNDENSLPGPQPKNIVNQRWEVEPWSFGSQTCRKRELCAPGSSPMREAADRFYKLDSLMSAGVS